MTVNDPDLGIFPGVDTGYSKVAEWGECGCWTCVLDHQIAKGPGMGIFMPFIVCPSCGNKRCPKGSHHDNPCTGSNEPGQPGSRYGGV